MGHQMPLGYRHIVRPKVRCKNLLLFPLLTPVQGVASMDEGLLVRDTLYLMQGISGKYIRFAASNDDDKKLLFTNDSVSRRSPFSWRTLALTV